MTSTVSTPRITALHARVVEVIKEPPTRTPWCSNRRRSMPRASATVPASS